MSSGDFIGFINENDDPNYTDSGMKIDTQISTAADTDFDKTIEDICTWIQKHPVFTINEIRNDMRIDRNTISATVHVLEWIGLVSKANTKTKKKAFRWLSDKPASVPVKIVEKIKSFGVNLP